MEEIRVTLHRDCYVENDLGEQHWIYIGRDAVLIVPVEHAAGLLASLADACTGLPGAGAAVTSAKVVQTLRDLGMAGQKRREEADRAMKGGNRG